MNRVTSSSNAQMKKVTQPQPPPEKKERNLKRERLPTNPLRGFSTRSSVSSSCSNDGGSESTSGESLNGCHRFLLSDSFSSSSSTSSSLGVLPHGGNKPVRLVSKHLIRKNPKYLEEIKLKSIVTEKPKRCRRNFSSKKRAADSKITMKQEKSSVLKKQSSVSRDVKLKDCQISIKVDDSIVQIVTPVTKLGPGSDLIYRSNGEATMDDRKLSSNRNSSCRERTPPVEASVSPEIQCGSSANFSASVQSQACYAAGHLLSGVSDKRKCKPKGILTVGENGFEVGKAKILSAFEEGEFGNGGNCNNISVMPLPADASVQWLLSPCDEEKEQIDDGFTQFQQIVECPSPLSDRSTCSDLCNISSDRSLSPMNMCKDTVRRTSSSLSPNELSRFRRFMHLSSCENPALALDTTPACEQDPSESRKGDKPSPVSVDTLGSENVIQTPESNSSFNHYFKLSCEVQKKHDFGSDLESLTTTLQSTSLSPRGHGLPKEPSSTSFNFDSLASSYDSIDLSHFQRGLVDGSPHPSHFTRDRESRKHVRGSRREGINSHMPESEGSVASAGKGSKWLPCSVAESICTDHGGLICSKDSNWMACYKN